MSLTTRIDRLAFQAAALGLTYDDLVACAKVKATIAAQFPDATFADEMNHLDEDLHDTEAQKIDETVRGFYRSAGLDLERLPAARREVVKRWQGKRIASIDDLLAIDREIYELARISALTPAAATTAGGYRVPAAR